MSRDRDRILEQALKHELRAAGTPADAHLDAETLAAWADDALDAAATASCEAHVSNCSRCQALVAAMARGTPSTLGTPGTLGTPRSLSLWKWWLAPIAAGVTAVTVWMVIPEEQQRFADAPAQTTVSRAAESLAQPAPGVTQPQKPAAEGRIEVDKLAAATREDRQQQNQAISEAKREEPERQLRDRAASADTAVAAAPSPAAPSPGVPAPAAVALEAPAAGADVGALQKSARLAAPPAEIATFDSNRRWRVAGDRIERTVDGGKSWTVIHQEPGAGLTAGSAPSLLVCWFVGRAGTVLLTTDAGATFTRVDLAEPLDLASVAGVDARNAAIYSVSGRRFRTSDGGQTWLPF